MELAVHSGPRPARPPASMSLRERGRLRRRVRFLRKQRELQLRDLGGLIFDMYRFGSKRQDLVREKLREMFAADRELREFEQMLGERVHRLDVREAGVGGACPRCLTLYSTEAHFCSHCGLALGEPAEGGGVVEHETVAEGGGVVEHDTVAEQETVVEHDTVAEQETVVEHDTVAEQKTVS